jgi:hypothetical protein
MDDLKSVASAEVEKQAQVTPKDLPVDPQAPEKSPAPHQKRLRAALGRPPRPEEWAGYRREYRREAHAVNEEQDRHRKAQDPT